MAKGSWIAIGVLAAIGLVLLGIVGSAIGTYNSFVNESESVDAQGEQVDVAYQRAFRLVPQIVNLSDRYMDKTSDAYARVAALRSGIAEAEGGTLAEKDAATQNIGTTFNLAVEAYPQIRSDAIYGDLIAEITNTENKIAIEKVRYNDYARDFNAHTKRCCIPMLVAGAFGFEPKEYIGLIGRDNQTPIPTGQST